jgi:hypothetical protein
MGEVPCNIGMLNAILRSTLINMNVLGNNSLLFIGTRTKNYSMQNKKEVSKEESTVLEK